MSDIQHRLRASVRMDAVHGDTRERSVCAMQMVEAAYEIELLTSERDALAKDVEQVRALLLRAGEELVCGDSLMSDGDAWQDSHFCGRCDNCIDRNWTIRAEIRAALAQLETERPE